MRRRMETTRVLIDDDPAPGDLAFLEAQINAYNIQKASADDYRKLAAFVRRDDGVVAGISGYTWAGMCEIQFLWVAEQWRGQGFGRQLLAAAEHEARAR